MEMQFTLSRLQYLSLRNAASLSGTIAYYNNSWSSLFHLDLTLVPLYTVTVLDAGLCSFARLTTCYLTDPYFTVHCPVELGCASNCNWTQFVVPCITQIPTISPSKVPSQVPSRRPSQIPSRSPSAAPSGDHTCCSLCNTVLLCIISCFF
jgi:hypothetical protein